MVWALSASAPYPLLPVYRFPGPGWTATASWGPGAREVEAASRGKGSKQFFSPSSDLPCPSSSGLLKATLSHLGSSGRETAPRVPMFPPVSRSNMSEALCSWAWIPAGSEQKTEGSTHSSRLQFVQGFITFSLEPHLVPGLFPLHSQGKRGWNGYLVHRGLSLLPRGRLGALCHLCPFGPHVVELGCMI